MNTGLKLMLIALSAVTVIATGTSIAPAISADHNSAAAAEAATVGKPAPEISLTDSQNKKQKLSQYKGKFVVLEWVNFQCPFVKKHYESGNMQKLQKSYTKKGVVWLTICSSAPGKPGNLSSAEINKTLKEKGAAPTAYLIDADGTAGKNYGAKTTPNMYVIDPKGVLVYAGAIDDKVSTDVADIASAQNYVTAALDQAMEGQNVKIASTKPYGCSVKY